jgi:CRP/FNR family cyclic AMP-dependent transcriptional regulator
MDDVGDSGARFASSPFVRRREPDIWESIAHLGTQQTYSKGETIYRQGALVDKMHYLKSGRVKIFTVDANGLERLITIIEPGNTFGEGAAFDQKPCYVSAEAMAASVSYAFGTHQIMRAMSANMALMRVVLDELAHKQRILALQAEAFTFSISERVALLLCHLSASYGTNSPDEVGRRVHVDVPLSELATILGMSRVTISRELAKLLKSGVVSKSGRDIILNPKALEERMPPIFHGALPDRPPMRSG